MSQRGASANPRPHSSRASASSTSSYSGTPVKHQRRDNATYMTGQQENPFPVMPGSKENPDGSIRVVHTSTYDRRTDHQGGDLSASAPRTSPGTQRVLQDRHAEPDRMQNAA